MKSVRVEKSASVAVVELSRPPHNYIDEKVVSELVDEIAALDVDPKVRSILLCSEGKNFCAGADFNQEGRDVALIEMARSIYKGAIKMFRCTKPIVAAVQGGAIGGGLGLALTADFRVVDSKSYFIANFAQLGIHPGFGLTYTLPRLIGSQRAAHLFYTGRRVEGVEAHAMGLADLLAGEGQVRSIALELTKSLAASSPLAVTATKQTLRQGLADNVMSAMDRELDAQSVHFETEDFVEGVRAFKERRAPEFKGR